MGRITDIIASVTNAVAGIKPGDTIPLTAIVNPDGSSFSGGGGGGGATGSVTPAGTNGTQAQAVQGITNGVPIPTSSMPVSGTNERDIRASGTINAATANAVYSVALNGAGALGFVFTGLAASGATLTYEQSLDDGATWTGMNEVNAGTGALNPTRTTDGQIRLSASGRTNIRVRVSTTGTGAITVASNASVREAIFSLGSPLPPGGNVVGVVNPPAAAGGKVIETIVAVPANASTQLVAARAGRLAMEIQPDGTAEVGISRNGAAVASIAASPLVIPAGSKPLYTMPIVSLTAITAFTATAQNVRVTEYIA